MPSSVSNFQRDKLRSFVPDYNTMINLENIASFCKSAFPERYDYFTPANSSTVDINSKVGGDIYNVFMVIDGAATITNLTIRFPIVSSCLNGQEVTIAFARNLTNAVFDANGAIFKDPLFSFTQGINTARKYKFLSGTWYPVGRY